MSAKRKLPMKLGRPMVKQSAKALNVTLDQSRTVVSSGGDAINKNRDVIDISSDSSSAEEEEEEEEDDDDDEDEDLEARSDESEAEEHSDARRDATREDAKVSELSDDEGETGEPSFGDLIRANIAEPIDVMAELGEETSHTSTHPQGTQTQSLSGGASLGTVLTQALKTNDVALLESCLQTSDIKIIRATIERLDSPLASILSHKLAERLYRRPGRAGSLVVWVQSIMVIHGGYLATQPDLMKKLGSLDRVILGRSSGLQTVLSSKGKLDMLWAQLELKNGMRNQQRSLDDEEDDGVIYVEGQDSDEEGAKLRRPLRNGNPERISDIESEISEDMPVTNGEIVDSDDEEDSSDADLIDEEAEETDADSGDEEEMDYEDQDSQGENEESDDGVQAPPPSKVQRTSGMFSRKR